MQEIGVKCSERGSGNDVGSRTGPVETNVRTEAQQFITDAIRA